MTWAAPAEAFSTPIVPAPLVASWRTALLARVWPALKLIVLVPRGKALPG